jgi:predicted Zn-dependent peptidase
MFGPEHPYGHPVGGDENTLRAIDRRAVQGYYRRLYTGSNVAVVAVGDFDPRSMRERLAQLFGALPAGERYQWIDDRAPEPAASPRVLLVDKADAEETYFVIGRRGLARTHPDRIATLLVNALIGGGFTSMLNAALRIQSGLTYGANCVLDQNRLTGTISIRSYTPTPYTAEALNVTLAVLHSLAARGISAEELAAAKRYVKGNYLTETLEAPDQLAATLAEIELYGLDRDEVDSFYARIDAVTMEQVNAAAKKYFSTEGIAIVLVGDRARIRNIALRYAQKPWEISIDEPGYDIFERLEPDRGVNVSQDLRGGTPIYR